MYLNRRAATCGGLLLGHRPLFDVVTQACARGAALGAAFAEFGDSIMATIPITKRGAEKLKVELQRLKTVDRPAVIQAIAEARAQGDLSENAEYESAKEQQGFIEGRILEVEGKLSAAQVIDPTELDAGGRVVFGATVDLEDEDSGSAVTYQIVGEDEADLKHGLINVSSPIARALIGKEEGDTAVVQAPGGERRYEIVGVKYI
jgi:transcription elongation factor GreA